MAPSIHNGSVPVDSPQQQVDNIMKKDEQKQRVAVHTFNPDASPEEKAAAAGKGRDQTNSVVDNPMPSGGKEVSIVSGSATMAIPTVTVSDADEKTGPDHQTMPLPPGAMPAGPAPTIPDWYKVGWREVGGIDVPEAQSMEAKNATIIEKFLSEQYYGAWYHNAGVVFFAVLASHFATLFRFGWAGLFIILAFCSTHYTISMARFRRRARDDIQRELIKTRLISEHESADWINNFLDRFWLIYEPVLSATIISSVDQILSQNTPAFLDSIRLSTFTLGTKAPRIDKVWTFPKTDEDTVVMDWGLSFTPSDISDITPKEAKKRVNPKIVLAIRLGKGFVGGAVPILLEDINFTGLLRIRMKLMTNFPHVQIVDISFLEKPVFDYVLKPIGGDTFGFDIGNVPGLSAFIQNMVHSTLGPMMYDPNVFTLNLEQLLSGTPVDSAIGVLQVTVHSARGLKGGKIGGGTPDPYVSLSISKRAELAKTKYKHSTHNPTWNETKFILINSLSESITFSVLDYNEHRKDTEMGSASFDLSKLQEDATLEDLESKILKDGKEGGDLRYDLSFFPVLKPEKGEDGREKELPDTKVGIVRFTIHQAKDLDSSKSMSGDLNPFASVTLAANGPPIHTTPRFKHTNNPVWESSTEFLCSDKSASIITVRVVDDREILKDPTVGYISIKLEDLLQAKKDAEKDWWPLSGCKSGRVRMSAEWKPLNMAGSLHGADQYVPPIGIVRLWMQKAADVKNVEATLGGKSDPYVRVQINNVTVGRTEVVNNNLNPEWDQIIYIPVHTLKEVLLLECMDYQHLTKDRSLGSVELRVADIAKASEDTKYPYASTGKQTSAAPLRLDRGNVFKGTLHFVAEFVPAIALKNIGFESGGNELQQIVDNVDTDDEGSVASSTTHAGISNGVGAPSTVQGPAKVAKSTDTTKSVVDGMPANGEIGRNSSQEDRDRGVDMSKEELFKHQSGILVCNVRSGQLSQKGRLDVLLDEAYWPAFSTVRARSVNAKWDHVGEGFIKELDFGKVWLRLNESEEGDKDDIISEFQCDARTFIEQAMDEPARFILTDVDGKRKSTVEVEVRYVPVDITLEPRESVNNQGILRVELVDGRDIRGVDRGGKSDPYVVFSLNGQKVFKSQTKKKTRTPEWSESFTVSVPSRVNANFFLEVFDWNQVEQAKKLGTGTMTLFDLEPFVGAERWVPLATEKHGSQGEIRVNLLFTPEIIAKTRKNTSTFSTAGRAMTQIGTLPVGAGKGVVHGIEGVGKTFGSIFKRKDYAKHTNGSEGTINGEDS